MTTHAGIRPQAEDRAIVLTRTFDAPAALVFRMWTEPEHVARWWGPQGFVTRVSAMDVRPGGRLAFRVRFPDGPEFALGGTYREVDPPRRLVHTWATDGDPVETTVSYDLRAELGATRIILTHVGFVDRVDSEQNDAGWRHQLDRLDALLQTMVS